MHKCSYRRGGMVTFQFDVQTDRTLTPLVVFANEVGHLCQQGDLCTFAGVKFLQFGDGVSVDGSLAVCSALQLFVVYDDQLLTLAIVPCEVNVQFQHRAAQLQRRRETAKRIFRRQAGRTAMADNGEVVVSLRIGSGCIRIHGVHVESGFGFD